MTKTLMIDGFVLQRGPVRQRDEYRIPLMALHLACWPHSVTRFVRWLLAYDLTLICLRPPRGKWPVSNCQQMAGFEVSTEAKRSACADSLERRIMLRDRF